MRQLLPTRPLVSLKTRTWAFAMYLMTFSVRGESSPGGRSCGSDISPMRTSYRPVRLLPTHWSRRSGHPPHQRWVARVLDPYDEIGQLRGRPLVGVPLQRLDQPLLVRGQPP